MERLYTFTPGFWLSALLHAIVFLFLLTKSQHQLVEIISKPQVLPDFVVEQMTPPPVMRGIEAPITLPAQNVPPRGAIVTQNATVQPVALSGKGIQVSDKVQAVDVARPQAVDAPVVKEDLTTQRAAPQAPLWFKPRQPPLLRAQPHRILQPPKPE